MDLVFSQGSGLEADHLKKSKPFVESPGLFADHQVCKMASAPSKSLPGLLESLRRFCQVTRRGGDFESILAAAYAVCKSLMQPVVFGYGNWQSQSARMDWQFTVVNDQELSLEPMYMDSELEALGEDKPLLLDGSDCQAFAASMLAGQSVDVQIGSMMIVPIVSAGPSRDLLCIGAADASWHEQDAKALLDIVAAQLASALEIRWFRQLSRSGSFPGEEFQSVVQLARAVVHEFNQPLTGISGYCALIKEELQDNGQLYRDIDEIEKQARRLEELVQQFHSVANLTNVPKTPERKYFRGSFES